MTPQLQAAQEAASFVDRLNDAILFPLITLLSAVALLVFLYGCAEYIMNAANDQAREQGKKHITFGIIGLLVMVSAYSILMLATGTFGLERKLDCANNPSASGCDSTFRLSPSTTIIPSNQSNPNYSNEGRNNPPSTNNPNYSNEGRNNPPSTNNPNFSNEGRNNPPSTNNPNFSNEGGP